MTIEIALSIVEIILSYCRLAVKVTDRHKHTHTDTQTETDKPIAICEILQICLIIHKRHDEHFLSIQIDYDDFFLKGRLYKHSTLLFVYECGTMSAGSDGDYRQRTRQSGTVVGRRDRGEVRRQRERLQLRAGVASSRLRQRVEEDEHEARQQRHDELPRVLRRCQGVATSAVLHLEHHRRHGEDTCSE